MSAETIPDELLNVAREAYHSAFNEFGNAKDQDVYAAIAQAIHDAVMAETEWMPIETAPADGGFLLLYFPKQGGRNMLGEMTKVDRYPVSYPRQPTHWMPLPAAPKAEGK